MRLPAGPDQMKNSNGFSLVETLIVIAIIAVLATIAVPSFTGQRSDTRLRDAVSMVRADFEMARSRAIRENAFVAVITTANSYTIFIDDGVVDPSDPNWWKPDGKRILRARTLPPGLAIDTAQTTLDNQRTRFNGRGYIGNMGVLALSGPDGRAAAVDMNNRFGRITTH
jgi:prepilin-type N-terminal cleavage/methylation domain-containing protein